MLTEEQKRRNREVKKQRIAYFKGLDEQRKKELAAQATAAKREGTLNSVTITLTEKERKFLDRALNPASAKAEWEFAWMRLGESLRRRNIERRAVSKSRMRNA
jgi:hypothetical protein